MNKSQITRDFEGKMALRKYGNGGMVEGYANGGMVKGDDSRVMKMSLRKYGSGGMVQGYNNGGAVGMLSRRAKAIDAEVDKAAPPVSAPAPMPPPAPTPKPNAPKPIRFANGGTPMGTDTVPAMLTPEEYVLPVKTARALGGPEVLDELVLRTNGKPAGGKVIEGVQNNARGGTIYAESGGSMPSGSMRDRSLFEKLRAQKLINGRTVADVKLDMDALRSAATQAKETALAAEQAKGFGRQVKMPVFQPAAAALQEGAENAARNAAGFAADVKSRLAGQYAGVRRNVGVAGDGIKTAAADAAKVGRSVLGMAGNTVSDATGAAVNGLRNAGSAVVDGGRAVGDAVTDAVTKDTSISGMARTDAGKAVGDAKAAADALEAKKNAPKFYQPSPGVRKVGSAAFSGLKGLSLPVLGLQAASQMSTPTEDFANKFNQTFGTNAQAGEGFFRDAGLRAAGLILGSEKPSAPVAPAGPQPTGPANATGVANAQAAADAAAKPTDFGSILRSAPAAPTGFNTPKLPADGIYRNGNSFSDITDRENVMASQRAARAKEASDSFNASAARTSQAYKDIGNLREQEALNRAPVLGSSFGPRQAFSRGGPVLPNAEDSARSMNEGAALRAASNPNFMPSGARQALIAKLNNDASMARQEGANAVSARGQDLNYDLGLRRENTSMRGQDLQMAAEQFRRENSLENARIAAEASKYGSDNSAAASRYATDASERNNENTVGATREGSMLRLLSEQARLGYDRENLRDKRFVDRLDRSFMTVDENGKPVADRVRQNLFEQWATANVSPSQLSSDRGYADAVTQFNLAERMNARQVNNAFGGRTSSTPIDIADVRPASYRDVASGGLTVADYLRSKTPGRDGRVVVDKLGRTARFTDMIGPDNDAAAAAEIERRRLANSQIVGSDGLRR